MNPETISLGKDQLRCPTCGEVFKQFAGVTPGHSQTVRKGAYWVCAHCSNLSVVGDSNLQNVTEEMFKALPRHVQQAVEAIVRTLRDNTVKTTDLN